MSSQDETQAQPFLKWVGGKRQVLPHILPRIPAQFDSYWEPFLGGGAMFFEMRSMGGKHSWNLGDFNQELVVTYQAVKKHPQDLIALLHKHQHHHNRQLPFQKKDNQWIAYPQDRVWYYLVRSNNYAHRDSLFTKADPDVLAAARFIYLNRTCFNGLHRVNRKGEFNVPAGQYLNPDIIQQEKILACSKALQRVKLNHGSYPQTSRNAKEGDFVYLDPPYDVWDASSFTGYNSDGFAWQQQQELALWAKDLKDQGALVMLSNHATPRIINLYKRYGFAAHCFGVKRSIAASGSNRGAVGEVLLIGYPQKQQANPQARRISLSKFSSESS